MSEQGPALCDGAQGSAGEVQRLIQFRSCRIDGLWAAKCRLFQPTLLGGTEEGRGGELIKCSKRWKRRLVSMSVSVMCCRICTFGECSCKLHVGLPAFCAEQPGAPARARTRTRTRVPPVETPATLGHHQLNARFSDGGTKTRSVSECGKKKGQEEGDGS